MRFGLVDDMADKIITLSGLTAYHNEFMDTIGKSVDERITALEDSPVDTKVIEEVVKEVAKEYVFTEEDPIFTAHPISKVTQDELDFLGSGNFVEKYAKEDNYQFGPNGRYSSEAYKIILNSLSTKDKNESSRSLANFMVHGKTNDDDTIKYLCNEVQGNKDMEPGELADINLVNQMIEHKHATLSEPKCKEMYDGGAYTIKADDEYRVFYGHGTLNLPRLPYYTQDYILVCADSEGPMKVAMEWDNGTKTIEIPCDGSGCMFSLNWHNYWFMISGHANTIYTPTAAYTVTRDDGVDIIIVKSAIQITLPADAAYNGRAIKICFDVSANQNKVQPRYQNSSGAYTNVTVSANHFISLIGVNGAWYEQ